MLLLAKDLTKRYGSRTVLDRVSFSVRQGELLGLIGPNGAGKTTLFECLAELLPFDYGDIRFEDQRVATGRMKEHLFYLPDAIRPWPDQPLGWLLDYFEEVMGGAAGERRVLAKALGLDSLLRSRVGSLSKGELKRFLLALGLLSPRPLLLLDEPFDGLDFRQSRDAMELLRSYPAKGRTLFLSIHQLTDAARVCDRLVLLSRGQVVGEGTLEELRSHSGLASDAGLEEVFLALT